MRAGGTHEEDTGLLCGAVGLPSLCSHVLTPGLDSQLSSAHMGSWDSSRVSGGVGTQGLGQEEHVCFPRVKTLLC